VSVLPPLLAIGLAIVTRQVYLSLAAGIWLGWTAWSGWNPLRGWRGHRGTRRGARRRGERAGHPVHAGDRGADRDDGGVGRRSRLRLVGGGPALGDGPRRARLLAWVARVLIFIESNITVLVAGAVSRPLFDRFRVSREKLAYLIDSTSAPICILIPLNAWGAYVLGILGDAGSRAAAGGLRALDPVELLRDRGGAGGGADGGVRPRSRPHERRRRRGRARASCCRRARRRCWTRRCWRRRPTEASRHGPSTWCSRSRPWC
jgi:hypothetical protein